MRKRSGWVTALAVWFIVTGVVGGAGAAYSLAILPRFLEEQIMRLETQQAESKGQARRAITPEQARQLLRQWLSERRQPVAQTWTLLYGLLGIGTLVVGIGLLQLQGWARLLAIWQAGVSISLVLWEMYALAFRFRVLDVMNMFADPAIQERAGRLAPTIIGTTVVFRVMEICWNGFVIGFFMRPGVKAQFVSKMTNR